MTLVVGRKATNGETRHPTRSHERRVFCYACVMKWKYHNLKRLYRLMFPEQSVKDFIKCVGAFWLWRHGVKREARIRLWKSEGWYCPDFCIPEKKLIVEVKGGWQKYYDGDVARDQALIDKGWRVIRVAQTDILNEPKKVKRYVRQFLKA